MTIPETIEAHRPDPLSDATRATRDGQNVNLAADLEAVKTCPIEELPEVLKGPRLRMEKRKRQDAEDDAELARELAEFRRLQTGTTQVHRRTLVLEGLKAALTRYTGLAKPDLAANWALWSQQVNGMAALHGAVLDSIVATKMLEALPPIIQSEEATLSRMKSELDELAKKFK